MLASNCPLNPLMQLVWSTRLIERLELGQARLQQYGDDDSPYGDDDSPYGDDDSPYGDDVSVHDTHDLWAMSHRQFIPCCVKWRHMC